MSYNLFSQAEASLMSCLCFLQEQPVFVSNPEKKTNLTSPKVIVSLFFSMRAVSLTSCNQLSSKFLNASVHLLVRNVSVIFQEFSTMWSLLETL